MKAKKVVYIIQGFESRSPEGNLHDVAVFEVYANDEKTAMERVLTYTTVPKKFYRIDKVIETFK